MLIERVCGRRDLCHQTPVWLDLWQTLRGLPAAARRRRVSNVSLTDEEQQSIRARITMLELEHGDLNDIIDRLVEDPALDQLQLRRLKKRKLLLKDQITRLQARLIPDIIA